MEGASLVEVLEWTLAADLQRIHMAEAQLREWESSAEFPLELLKIATNEGGLVHIKQVSVWI